MGILGVKPPEPDVIKKGIIKKVTKSFLWFNCFIFMKKTKKALWRLLLRRLGRDWLSARIRFLEKNLRRPIRCYQKEVRGTHEIQLASDRTPAPA